MSSHTVGNNVESRVGEKAVGVLVFFADFTRIRSYGTIDRHWNTPSLLLMIHTKTSTAGDKAPVNNPTLIRINVST